MVRVFWESSHWLKAVVMKQLGPVSYLVKLVDGRIWKHHIDHIRARQGQLSSQPEDKKVELPMMTNGPVVPLQPSRSDGSVEGEE